MPRDAAANAAKQLKTTNAIGSGANQQAGQTLAGLEPQLQQRAVNPPGMSPTDMNAARTGSAQALGAGTGGVTGLANLEAARTGNVGGFSSALDQASREAGQTGSQNELALDTSNAALKQTQQQQALTQLQGLYGTQVGQGESYYGMAPSEINAQTAASPGWAQTVSGLMTGLGDLGKGAGAFIHG